MNWDTAQVRLDSQQRQEHRKICYNKPEHKLSFHAMTRTQQEVNNLVPQQKVLQQTSTDGKNLLEA